MALGFKLARTPWAGRRKRPPPSSPMAAAAAAAAAAADVAAGAEKSAPRPSMAPQDGASVAVNRQATPLTVIRTMPTPTDITNIGLFHCHSLKLRFCM